MRSLKSTKSLRNHTQSWENRHSNQKDNLRAIPTNQSFSMNSPFNGMLLLLSLLILLPCHASDQLALLYIKASITKDPLQALSSWNGSNNFCHWQGVSCSRRHSTRVTILDLSSFNLSGTIPSSIANLTFLQRLNLADNNFHGHIPPEVGRLRRLQYLNLSSNSLNGVIPATLSYCSKLQVISLRNNLLTGGIPYNLSNCPNLQIITLKDNQLTGGIPDTFGNLPELLYLDAASNNLTGVIPPSLGNISSLVALELYENSVSGAIPPSLSQLSSLVFLRLYRNSLTGSIPSSLGNLSSLQYFSLSYNNITGELPASMGNLSSLVQLDISVNSFSGAIPPWLGHLSSLAVLALTSNSFSGGIPPALGYLSSLSVMALSHNFLTGKVPQSIYNLSLMEYFGLANNNLEDTLPRDLGQYFPRLQKIYLYFNNFHGQIPGSLANASGLQDIELTGNNFTGKIPANLGMLQQLYWLSLDRNQLEAGDEAGWSFFSSLTNCSLLQVLSLEQNGLGGALPRTVGNLSTTLEWLTMGDNQLTGTIPVAIGKLQMINTLDLSVNKLSGVIPASLGGCQVLGSLDLSDNKLTGSIPKEVLSLSSLSKYLNLSNNLLSGSLPPEVGRLRNLRELYIAFNSFSGVIPNTIGECEVLEILHMNHNGFEGIIPPTLSNLKGIQELDLASNNFSGPIPQFLESLSFLQYLNLSFNNLEGQVPSKGVFQNVSAVSVQGNELLCGDPKLNLSTCSSEMLRKRDHSKRFKIILSVSVSTLFVLIVLCLLGFLYWMHCRKKKLSKDTTKVQNANVSYFDILKATDGFSSSNLIGVGGHGSVYKGILNLGEEKVVAIKVLNLQQKGALKSFTAECNALKAIRHRNLTKIITSCSSLDNKGNAFKALIFQYMTNGSLEEWLHSETREGCRLNFLQRINIAIDIASALEYLHHHSTTPVIHCDLKPSNVLLDDDMTAHVSDFGVAKLPTMQESKWNAEIRLSNARIAHLVDPGHYHASKVAKQRCLYVADEGFVVAGCGTGVAGSG